MADFIIAIGTILTLLSGWLFVQHLSRWYAAHHPEFGPAREEGGGCGSSCQCSAGHCIKKQHSQNHNQQTIFLQEDRHHDQPQ